MYRARDVMSTNVTVLHEDATVVDAIRTLVENGISGAPVVNRDGDLVGVVSEYRLLEAIYVPQFKACEVREIMTKEPLSITENMYLSDVADLLMQQRIRRLPVVRDGSLVGIVARRDLLRYVMDTGEELDRFLGEVASIA